MTTQPTKAPPARPFSREFNEANLRAVLLAAKAAGAVIRVGKVRGAF